MDEIVDIEGLKTAVRNGYQPKYIFFWGHTPGREGQVDKSCLSQWYPAEFVVDGVMYKTAEHYMMAGKARLFNDEAALQKILIADHPGEAKKLGRGVRGFDSKTWTDHCFEIVVEANVAKFGQNEALKDFLLTSGDRVLVEASPYDKIWGIGLAADDVRAQDLEKWQGQNLLGFALMAARRILAGEES